MTMPKKSSGNALLEAARDIGVAARLNGACRYERAVPPYYISLRRIDAMYRLVLAHRDRTPSYDEMRAVCEAAGAPGEAEPIRTFVTLASQDGHMLRLPSLVAQWRES